MQARRSGSLLLALALGASTLSGCAAALNNTERGAVIGASAGAVLGAAMGKKSGDTEKGAIVGAVVGGAVGAIIGREIEAQARTLRDSLPDARVEQEGEELKITFDSGILFDFNSAVLRVDAERNLGTLAENLLRYPGYHVEIAGHTDSRGSAEYNQALSERRARAAAERLLARGVSPARITTVGYGATRPVDTNATDAGRQANRRVEVTIFASEAYRQEVEGRRTP